MNTNTQILHDAAEWLNRTHTGRTQAEKQAYLEALDSVGIPENIYTEIYNLFFKDESNG